MTAHGPVPPHEEEPPKSDGPNRNVAGKTAPPRAAEGPATGTYASVGLQFAIAIILFLLLGQWLDDRFGTTPVFVIAGVFLGAGAAFYNMYRKLMAQHHDEEKKQ